MSLTDFLAPGLLNVIGAVVIVVAAFSLGLALRGRNRRFSEAGQGDRSMDQEATTAGLGHGALEPGVLQPPDDLEPAEAVLLVEGKVSGRAVAASLVQLIVRGFVERDDNDRLRLTGQAAAIGAGAPIGWFAGEVAMCLADAQRTPVSLREVEASPAARHRLAAAKARLTSQASAAGGWFRRSSWVARRVARVAAIIGGSAGLVGLVAVVAWVVMGSWTLGQRVLGLLSLFGLGLGVTAAYLAMRKYHTTMKFWIVVSFSALVVWGVISAVFLQIADPTLTLAIPWWQAVLAWFAVIIIILAYPYGLISGLLGWKIAVTVFLALIGGFALFGVVGTQRLGLWVIALILSAVWLGRTATGRVPLTTAGSVAAARVESFSRFLAATNLEELRFKVGEDAFASYLPWAVALAPTEQWAPFIASAGRIGAKAVTTDWFDDSGPYDPLADGTGFIDAAARLTQGASPGQAVIDRLGARRTATTG